MVHLVLEVDELWLVLGIQFVDAKIFDCHCIVGQRDPIIVQSIYIRLCFLIREIFARVIEVLSPLFVET